MGVPLGAAEVREPYAIGGAIAMRAHGYARQTSSVEALLRDHDRFAWLRAARVRGLVVDPVRSGYYLASFARHRDPRVRLNLRFTAREPAVTAILESEEKPIGHEVTARVVGVELLVVDKRGAHIARPDPAARR